MLDEWHILFLFHVYLHQIKFLFETSETVFASKLMKLNMHKWSALQIITRGISNLWQEALCSENEDEERNFMSNLDLHETDNFEVSLSDSSMDVAHVIAGNKVKKLQDKLKCEQCASLMIDDTV